MIRFLGMGREGAERFGQCGRKHLVSKFARERKDRKERLRNRKSSARAKGPQGRGAEESAEYPRNTRSKLHYSLLRFLDLRGGKSSGKVEGNQ